MSKTLYFWVVTAILGVSALVDGCTAKSSLSSKAKFASGDCLQLDPANLESWEQVAPGQLPQFVIVEVGKRKYHMLTGSLASGIQDLSAKFEEVEDLMQKTTCPKE
jgi:hypothetical protein